MTLFGQSIISGELRLVEIVSENSKTTFIRKADRGIPYGDPFKRHNKKHKVKIHGNNVIRRDYMKN